MAHSILRVLAWAGVVIFVFGLLLHNIIGYGVGSGYMGWGIAFVIMAIIFALLPDVLRKDHVTDTWALLIENANGKASDILDGTATFLRESKAPSLGIAKKKVVTSLVQGVLGNEREFLVLTDKQKMALRPFQIFINARDYGLNLDVSWYVTYRPTMLQALGSLFGRSFLAPKEMDDLNVFDQQDVRAYAMNAFKCTRKAIIKVMEGVGQDPSKVDWKTKGFLGIS